MFEKTNNKQKEAGVGPSLKKDITKMWKLLVDTVFNIFVHFSYYGLAQTERANETSLTQSTFLTLCSQHNLKEGVRISI